MSKPQKIDLIRVILKEFRSWKKKKIKYIAKKIYISHK